MIAMRGVHKRMAFATQATQFTAPLSSGIERAPRLIDCYVVGATLRGDEGAASELNAATVL